ncbi:4-hydroxy-tetrahydrodipicolinate synthase [Ralstonia syzygii]
MDVDASANVMKALVDDGFSGLIICGAVGENGSLTCEEKSQLWQAAYKVTKSEIPVIAGVAEFTTALAIETASAAKRAGADASC